MQRSPDSELKAAWFDLTPKLQQDLLSIAPIEEVRRAPVLLGLSGKPEARLALGAIITVLKVALDTRKIPELPVYDVIDAQGNRTGISTLRIGIMSLSHFFPGQAELGSRKEAIAFVQHPDASYDEYSSSIDSVIRYSNDLLSKHTSSRIPSLSEFRYPLRGLDF